MNRGKCESFLSSYQLLELAKDPEALIGLLLDDVHSVESCFNSSPARQR